MIIQNNSQNICPNSYNSRQEVKVQNSPNFSGPRLPHQTFEEFEKFAKKTNFLKGLPDIIKEENFLGSGGFNIVYQIPNNDTFLLRVKKNIEINNKLNKKAKLIKAKDIFPTNNLGQKIATVGHNISIIIKQIGEPNGVKNWYKNSKNPNFPEEQIPEFIEKLQTVAKMDQKAFNNLGKEIKIVMKKDKTFDFINPQNILVDEANQNFNIIDIENEKHFKPSLKFNTKYCILHSLLDGTNIVNVYEKADKVQQEQIKIAAKKIKDKTNITVKTNNLSENEVLLKQRLEALGPEFIERYEKFKNLLESL